MYTIRVLYYRDVEEADTTQLITNGQSVSIKGVACQSVLAATYLTLFFCVWGKDNQRQKCHSLIIVASWNVTRSSLFVQTYWWYRW